MVSEVSHSEFPPPDRHVKAVRKYSLDACLLLLDLPATSRCDLARTLGTEVHVCKEGRVPLGHKWLVKVSFAAKRNKVLPSGT